MFFLLKNRYTHNCLCFFFKKMSLKMYYKGLLNQFGYNMISFIKTYCIVQNKDIYSVSYSVLQRN